jgi:hypothetical protein
VVRALRELGCVETRKVMVGEHMWMLPTRKGYSHCGLTYRPVPLSTMSLAHIAAINDVRIYIQQRSEDTRWVSERQLAAEAHRHSRRPDGVAIQDGRHLAIEVELHRKRSGIVQRNLDYLEGRFDGIVYFCAPAPHRQLTGFAESGRWPNLTVRELPRQKGWRQP